VLRTGSSELSWIRRALLFGGALAVLWAHVPIPHGLWSRVAHDLVLFVIAPTALALLHGRHIGYRIDRRALRNTALLAAFVVPFYVLGSTLPTVRAFYPMWRTSTALGEFLPHAVGQLLIAFAAETYYRGLLCVGVREIGAGSVFISPVLYAIHHVGKPPVELLLSGPVDVLFGAVDYRSRSILPSIVAHGFGLALLDWLVLNPPVVPSGAALRWLSWLPVPL